MVEVGVGVTIRQAILSEVFGNMILKFPPSFLALSPGSVVTGSDKGVPATPLHLPASTPVVGMVRNSTFAP